MKLAVFLIGYLAVTGILATLVPQGQEASAYATQYGRLLGELIIQTGFSRFFTSILFLIPAFVFFANLSACTIHRFFREIRKKSRRRHGPDILHIGLMLLVIGAVVSFSAKQEGSVKLSIGDKVQLPGERTLELIDFAYETYTDGRPKEWTSIVKLMKGETVEQVAFPIRVNHPLRIGRLVLYQFTHAVETSLSVTGPSGKIFAMTQGGTATEGAESLFFMAADDGQGKYVVRLTTGTKNEVLRVAPGEKAGGFTVTGMKTRDITGLHAVLDPGYPVILASLFAILVGLSLTFIQKLGDMKP